MGGAAAEPFLIAGFGQILEATGDKSKNVKDAAVAAAKTKRQIKILARQQAKEEELKRAQIAERVKLERQKRAQVEEQVRQAREEHKKAAGSASAEVEGKSEQ